MSLAAIILAHQRPDLLAHLVGTLGETDIAIHIDKKSKVGVELATEATRARPKGHKPLTFLSSRSCQWGSFTLVMVTLDGLRWFLQTGKRHVVLLSGQCAVIGAIEDVQENISKDLAGLSLLDAEPLPRKVWVNQGGGFDRLNRYWFSYPGGSKPRAVPILRRTPPAHMALHGGSQWMCLSREAATYILAYVDENPADLNFFKSSLIGDEMFLHTILMGSSLSDKIRQGTTHFMRWQQGTPHPATLSSEDNVLWAESNRWFARKFDTIDGMLSANSTSALVTPYAPKA